MKFYVSCLILFLGVAFGANAADHGGASPSQNAPITLEEVHAAQNAWAKGIVAIGASADPKAEAQKFLDTLYDFDSPPVLFRPTKAAYAPFRTTLPLALSYFVGGVVPQDKGFALTPFTQVTFGGDPYIDLSTPMALAMGTYYFTPANGKEIAVEYVFGYIRGKDGKLKIRLHVSTLPFASAAPSR